MFSRLLGLFKKEPKEKFDPYAYMGSVGVSPKHMMMYQEAVNKIEEYERNKGNEKQILWGDGIKNVEAN